MMRIRVILSLAILLTLCLQALPALSATYYISPTGSDANPGTSGKPWLTFAYALYESRAWCGNTLVLSNGTYGDGTRTGKININGIVCTAGDELIITAQNQRKAKIVDNGTSVAVKVDNSAYLVFDGLYVTSTDNSSVTSDRGRPFEILRSNHITLLNNLGKNPNRYANAHVFPVLFSQDVLLEDNEAYVFHRHCTTGYESERVVVRRQYCNPRGGGVSGGVGSVGKGDAVMSMYPCKDCILENSIADGTTHGMFLNEMNATFGSGILMSGSKVLGSICYKCSALNGIYPNARKVADQNHTPQNLTIRDVALVDHNSGANAIRCSNCVNALIDHVSILGTGAGNNGIVADHTSKGTPPATNSITITNTLVTNMRGYGFRVTGYNTWSLDRIFAYGNGTNFSLQVPSSWANTSMKDPRLGTCKLWVPVGAAVKGAGTGGGDIGATILYRYVNGVLTTTPLWNPKTGEFPHGAADLDGTNRVEGQSLFDIHVRLNVNTGGCSFPENYGDADTKKPAAPASLKAS
jgi:hypothetical protein